jgi:hypothetical protein
MTKTAAADPFGAEVDIYQRRNASPIVAALEAAWAQIRSEVPEVPQVIIAMAGAHDRSAHFADAKWETDEGMLAEVFINGELLARGAESVMGTLLHIAAHGLAHARGIKDTSRYGRYHNGEYAKVAQELGLDVENVGPYGFSKTFMSPGTKVDYAPEIAAITKALEGLSRNADVKATNGRKNHNNGVVAMCECVEPRRIRIAESVLALGPIECHLCGSAFEAR